MREEVKKLSRDLTVEHPLGALKRWEESEDPPCLELEASGYLDIILTQLYGVTEVLDAVACDLVKSTGTENNLLAHI